VLERPALVEAGEQEQILHEQAHALRLAADAGHRPLEVVRLGDREAHVVAERQAQVIRARDVGRVGDRDKEKIVGEEANRDGLVTEGELLLEQADGVAVGLALREVDVVESEQVGKRFRQISARHPAVADGDHAQPAAGQALFLECLLDLLDVEQPAVDQEGAEVLPGKVGRFHVGYIVVFVANMKAVVQRISRGRVSVDGEVVSETGSGLCVLLGIARGDDASGADRLAAKVAQLRVFENDEGRFDRSLLDVHGEALVVSQFTLIADAAKGNRPSFTDAAPPEEAEPLYEAFCEALRGFGVDVATGSFGARMALELVNDGPVTIVLP